MSFWRTSNQLSWLLILAAALLFAALFFLFLSSPSTVFGSVQDLTRVENLYPGIIGTRIDRCTLCHISTDPMVLNSYGAAYADAGLTPAALVAIQNLDSDGDGWSNLEEIQLLTFPGNANDHPYRFFIPSALRQ